MSRYVDIGRLEPQQFENSEVELGVLAYDYEVVQSEPYIDICFCRECQHCSKDRIKWSVKDEAGNWIDTKCNLCRRTKLEVDLDDFCSWGEREGE